MKIRQFHEWMNNLRTEPCSSDKPIAKEVIENIILSASAAPGGAYKHPWTFCIISDPAIRNQIRSELKEREIRKS